MAHQSNLNSYFAIIESDPNKSENRKSSNLNNASTVSEEHAYCMESKIPPQVRKVLELTNKECHNEVAIDSNFIPCILTQYKNILPECQKKSVVNVLTN
jgi:hypothetical protein